MTGIRRYDVDGSPLLASAIREIEKTYGDTVSVFDKGKSLLKFGRNEAVGASPATIMTLPAGVDNETYPNIASSTNNITTISSSNNGDTVSMVVEGHTVSGGLLTFVVQSVTLTGQTQATLTTPLARATRAYNNSATDLVGTIYVYETDTSTSGVPDTPAKVRLMIPAGGNQSVKASTSISAVDYWIVTRTYAAVLEKTNVNADVRLEVRRASGVWRLQADLAASSGDFKEQNFDPYFIVPKNSDVRLRATASTTNVDVAGGIEGYLALVVV